MLRLYNPRPPESRVNWKWTVGVVSAHVIALLALVGLGILNPGIPIWISEAAEAELAAYVPPAEMPRTQMAQPANPMQQTRIVGRLYR
jgi:hypothetical protein